MGQKMYNVTIQGITKQYPEKILTVRCKGYEEVRMHL